MITVCGKKAFDEYVAGVFLLFGTIFLDLAFLMAIGFLTGVLIVSVALPIDLYICLWISKTSYFPQRSTLKHTKLLVKYHDHLENKLHFSSVIIPI